MIKQHALPGFKRFLLGVFSASVVSASVCNFNFTAGESVCEMFWDKEAVWVGEYWEFTGRLSWYSKVVAGSERGVDWFPLDVWNSRKINKVLHGGKRSKFSLT